MAQLIFHATVINCVTDNNEVRIIGLGDHEQTPENYIIISKFEEEDQEVDDTIHIQSSINGGYYNAIECIAVEKKEITITILESMINKMGFSKAIIRYELENINMERFLDYLKEIFEGSSVNIRIKI